MAVFIGAFSLLLIALIGSILLAVNLGEPVAKVPTGRRTSDHVTT
jgi:hypothetical protein